ncbi:MAG TPA: MBL fold metallo-hydrolase [Candidatus Lambdaproteobacteria bacterium]|jgi:glyoxylase-like metal-dependent hydrolase (beta-lactamase superfamily II)|nr:MBL fold metallo-hydrolase [SAR324 cluster bacterium]MCK5899217.1 MBL fold metallo-hydrolase [bacterium]HBD29307.1 MBL fold metallo-hydrolase [Deltaproteobacteria bacterium]HIA34967.1 MBL fold metallo-hydrolase [Candidatus Lambdaproteobacteria bacterium]MEC8971895.1 MBL fold metallo-hydrolase [SAR324 cluster bacterium]|tara:strand:+ start:88 stop:732 length:645 start_codon:yes stop_codon:yes gene_type:complete
MNDADIIVETIPVGPLQCNCTILGDLVSRKAIVVDPGGDAEILLERLVELNLQVERIIHTHAHLDHFLASGKMKEATGAKLALHREDLFLWDMLEDQCRMFGIPFEPPPPPDQWLENEEEIDLNDLQGKALHTPGHTPGSMCFLFESQKLLIAGDTLFQGSIGRTDLWGGDFKKIEKSIQEKLYTLDEETSVITGHGESTSIGHEMRANSFVRA